MLISWMLNLGCIGSGAGVVTKAGDGAGTVGGGGAGGGTTIGPPGGSPGTLGGIPASPGNDVAKGNPGRGLVGGTTLPGTALGAPPEATSDGSSSVTGLTGDSWCSRVAMRV